MRERRVTFSVAPDRHLEPAVRSTSETSATAHIFAVQDSIFPSYDPSSATIGRLAAADQEQVASLLYDDTMTASIRGHSNVATV